jgi:hypothetical protein
MYAVLAPTAAIQSLTACATNSGPLSDLIKAGTPRRINRSVSTLMTSVELSLRSTRIARYSRLCSSRMFNVLKTFPSSVLWWTKSYDQTWSQYSGRSLNHEPSFNQSRPFFGCFIGTFSPSHRHRRSMRLSLTCQPVIPVVCVLLDRENSVYRRLACRQTNDGGYLSVFSAGSFVLAR